MNYTKNLMKKSEPLIEELKKLKEVEAIAFYGSIADGLSDKYSDIDLVCFYNKIISKESVEKVLNKINGIEIRKSERQTILFYKKKNIGIQYIKVNEMKRQLKAIIQRGYYDYSADKWFVCHVLNTKTVYDPKGIIKNMKKMSEKIYKIFIPKLITFFYPSIKDFLKSDEIQNMIKRKNWIYLSQKMDMVVRWYLTVLYALNNDLFFVSKWSFKKIPAFKRKPKNCVKRLEQISLLGNSLKGLKKKIKIFAGLIKDTDYLAKKYLS